MRPAPTPRRHAALVLLGALLAATAHANPWAERYDALCVAPPVALVDQRPDPALADHARDLLTATLEEHGIAYRSGTCSGARDFTLLLSLLVDRGPEGARVTFGLHQDAPELRRALDRIAAEQHQPSRGAEALARLDHALATIDAFSIHIDVGTHPDDDVAAAVRGARSRHAWLLESFARSWVGSL